MKKIFAVLIASAVMLLAFSACTKAGEDEPSSQEIISEQNNENMEYEDPGIDPELANRDLKDGDEISIDVNAGTIDAKVDFAARRASGKKPTPQKAEGLLYHYRHSCASASEGALIRTRDE